MIFALTEAHSLSQDRGRNFAESEVAPSAAERDEAERFDQRLFSENMARRQKVAVITLHGVGVGNFSQRV